jgi:hypothetical protein
MLGTVSCGYGPDAISYDDVKSEVEAVLLRSGTFTARMIEDSPKLRIIARHGVGTGHGRHPGGNGPERLGHQHARGQQPGGGRACFRVGPFPVPEGPDGIGPHAEWQLV